MLTLLVWINLLGLAGYCLFIAAPLAKSRARFLILDAAGMAPIAVHYVLLGAPAGAALSILYVLADIGAPLAAKRNQMLALQLVLLAAAIAAVAMFWSGPRDLLSLAGTALVITSRAARSYRLLLFMTLTSTLFWGSYGLLTGSYSQTAFSALYIVTCLVGMMRARGENEPGLPFSAPRNPGPR